MINVMKKHTPVYIEEDPRNRRFGLPINSSHKRSVCELNVGQEYTHLDRKILVQDACFLLVIAVATISM